MVYKQGDAVEVRLVVSDTEDLGRTCHNTGLYFPDTLYIDNKNMGVSGTLVVKIDTIPPSADSQSLSFFAMGTYYKAYFGVVINVYTVALYLDNEGLSNDPLLSEYKGKNITSNELTVPFVSRLLEDVPYDRTILIQLSISLSKSTLLNALVDDLGMTDKHKVRLCRVKLFCCMCKMHLSI